MDGEMKNPLEDLNNMINYFGKELNNCDLKDQLLVLMAFSDLQETLRPIYTKYMMKDQTVTNFLMKL